LNESKPRVAAALADRYRIERELGRGGAATVYLASDLRHGRSVAVKVLYPELAASLGAERFLREIEIAAGLAHPHILPLHDSGEADGFLYYVMPYIEGESLRHRLRREIQMPVEDALRIAREVAQALQYAHEHGIVHRDIKPENILLEGDHAVVADFGVARAIETAASERLTETGLAVGTAAYMSPEQAGGTGRVDGRSDIYSLGCVLFEMLAGEPPFGGGTPQAVVAKHMQARVPDLRVVRPLVSPALQRILQKALAKVPADRFGSAEALARELQTVSPNPAATSRRRLIPWAAAGTALALGAAALLTRVHGSASDANHPSAASGDDRPRVAVLAFEAAAGDSALARTAAGISDELIYELSGVNGLRVVSRSDVAPFSARPQPLDSLAAALRVTTVIEGSVQRWGDQLRVRVELIDAKSGTYVDSLSVDQPLPAPAGFERTVALEVAGGLRRRMGREVRLSESDSGSDNALARSFARRAQAEREHAREVSASPHPEDLSTAVEALRRADSLLVLAQRADPRWARLWSERGWVAIERAQALAGPPREAALQRALDLAQVAVRHAPESAEALELRGTVRNLLVTELQSSLGEPDRLHLAEIDLRAALDRDSTLTRAWASLSDLLWTKGRTAEAALAAERALREDTYLSEAADIYRNLFFSGIMLGNFSQAAAWCNRGRLAFPTRWRFVECELTLMRHDVSARPEPDSAWRLVETLNQLEPPDKARAEGLGYHPIYWRIVAATIAARAGHPGVARREIARARRATRADTTLSMDLNYDEAYLRFVLGERERAAVLLGEYLQHRPLARDYLARDPLMRAVAGSVPGTVR
jgi:eukaryotic-like serine/threonine-protein kinase